MDKICEDLKKLIDNAQKKICLENQIKSGTSNKLCSCLKECDCQTCKNANKIYIQDYLVNYKQFLPVGDQGLQFILNQAKQKWPRATFLFDKLSKEQSDREKYRESEEIRKNGNLPNPGVLIVNEATNTCSLCGFIEVEWNKNFIKSRLTHKNSATSYLKKAEILLYRNEVIHPKYILNISSPDVPLLSEKVNGDSAMLAYAIKRWYQEQHLTPVSSIAATGSINQDRTIGPVGNLILKLKSALEFGYKYIFYPECQISELLKSNIKYLQNNNKLIPIKNIDELNQRLFFLSEYKRSQTLLQQHLDGTRTLTDEKLKHWTRVYTEGLSATSKLPRLPYQIAKMYEACSNPKPSRKLALINLLLNHMYESNDKSDSFKIALIEATLPKPMWLALLPFIIKDLININNGHHTKEITELYEGNIERFYNHDLTLTVATRLFQKIKYATNVWEDKNFREKYPHIWGISCYDPFNLINDLSGISDRTPQENELLFKLLNNIFTTNSEAYTTTGISESETKKYFKGLKKLVDSLFPGFKPQLFRYLRSDQRLGALGRTLYSLNQQQIKKVGGYNCQVELLKLIDKLLSSTDVLLKKAINYNPSQNPKHRILIDNKNYCSPEGIKNIITAIKEIKNECGKTYDGFASYLRPFCESEKETENKEYYQPYIVKYVKHHLQTKTLVSNLFDNLRSILINCQNSSTDIIFNPSFGLADAILSNSKEKITNWLIQIFSLKGNFDNILNLLGLIFSLSFYAGYKLYDCEILEKTELLSPQNGTEKSNQNNQLIDTQNLFMLGQLINTEKLNDDTIRKLSPLTFYTASILLLLPREATSLKNKIKSYLINSDKKEEIAPLIANIAGLSISPKLAEQYKDYHYDVHANEKSWSSAVKKHLLETRREYRKIWFLDLMYNHPEDFAKLQLTNLDAENYSLTLMYLIAKTQHSDKRALFRKIEKKILMAGRNLFDTEVIYTIKLLEYYKAKNIRRIQKLLLSHKLTLLNTSIGLRMVQKLKNQ